MPTYDYWCPENGEVLEVKHGMNEKVSTWGELCRLAEKELGQTPDSSPVEMKFSFAGVGSSSSGASPQASIPPCAMEGGGCAGGACPF